MTEQNVGPNTQWQIGRRRLLQSAGAALLLGGASPNPLTVWKFGSPQEERAYFATQNKGFTAAPLNVQLFDFDARFQRIAAANSSGNMPDVMVIENSMVPSLVSANAIADLGQLDPNLATNYQGDYVPQLWQLGTWQGKLFGFSPYVDLSPMLLYNKDMLQAAGVRPPETWSATVAAAKALTAGGKFGIAFGASNNSVDIDTLESLAAVNGMRWVDDQGHAAIDTASLADTLGFIKALSAYAPTGLAEANFRAALQLFFQGRVAMVIVKSFAPIIQADYHVSPDFPGVLVKFPRPDKVAGPFASADFEAQASFLFTASHQGTNPATKDYIDFWADPAQQEGWTGSKIRGRVPSAIALLKSAEFARQYPGLAAEFEQGTLFKNVISIPFFPQYSDLRTDLTAAIQAVILGTASPPDSAAKLVEKTRAKLGA